MNLEEIKKIEKENKYNKKILDIKYESLPFLDFQNTRYSMTVKINIGQVYIIIQRAIKFLFLI